MKKFLLILIALFVSSFAVHAQNNSISEKCVNTTQKGIIQVTSQNLFFNPCPNKPSYFQGALQIRVGNTDSYVYANSLDIQTFLSTDQTNADSIQSIFNIQNTPYSTFSTYRNGFFSTVYNSPNRGGAALGLYGGASMTSSAILHDLHGVTGEATITNGQVYSNASGGVFSIGIFGGANHGDLADVIIGNSTIRDTSARTYQTLWIKAPTIINASITQLRSINQQGNLPVELNGMLITKFSYTPQAGEPCIQGAHASDDNNYYFCTSQGWKFIPLQSF